MKLLKRLFMGLMWFLLKALVGLFIFAVILAMIAGFVVVIAWVSGLIGEDFIKGVFIPGVFLVTGVVAIYGLGSSVVNKFRGR